MIFSQIRESSSRPARVSIAISKGVAKRRRERRKKGDRTRATSAISWTAIGIARVQQRRKTREKLEPDEEVGAEGDRPNATNEQRREQRIVNNGRREVTREGREWERDDNRKSMRAPPVAHDALSAERVRARGARCTETTDSAFLINRRKYSKISL